MTKKIGNLETSHNVKVALVLGGYPLLNILAGSGIGYFSNISYQPSNGIGFLKNIRTKWSWY